MDTSDEIAEALATVAAMRKLLVGILLLALAGCHGPSPSATPTPKPSDLASHAPLFASDEEALAAAEEAYKAYSTVEDEIGRDGGSDPERIAPFVTADWYEHEVSVFESFQTSGRHQLGSTSVRDVQLQQYSQEGPSSSVAIYVCLDFSTTSFVDAYGDPVPVDAPKTLTVVTTLESTEDGRLLISGSEPWS